MLSVRRDTSALRYLVLMSRSKRPRPAAQLIARRHRMRHCAPTVLLTLLAALPTALAQTNIPQFVAKQIDTCEDFAWFNLEV